MNNSSYPGDEITTARKVIASMIINNRQTVFDYCKLMAVLEDKNSKDWDSEVPGCFEAVYRQGMARAYTDIYRKIENGEFKV